MENNYAGFWIRLVAHFIDSVVLLIGLFILLLPTMFFESTETMLNLFSILFVFAYYVLMETSPLQGTLGKVAVGIKIVNETDDRISYGQSIGRYFSKIISQLILYIGYMMIGWSPTKQGLHDHMANTYVVYK